MWRLFLPLFLAGCVAAPASKPPEAIVFEVQAPRDARDCPPLPMLSDHATTAERTAFVRRVVQMYALCAKGSHHEIK